MFSRLSVRPACEIQLVLHRIPERGCDGSQFRTSHALHLFDDVWPIDLIVDTFAISQATQQCCLFFCPCHSVVAVTVHRGHANCNNIIVILESSSYFQRAPPLFCDFGPLSLYQHFASGLRARLPAAHTTGLWRKNFFPFSCCNPRNRDGASNHVGGTLLSLRTFWHRSLSPHLECVRLRPSGKYSANMSHDGSPFKVLRLSDPIGRLYALSRMSERDDHIDVWRVLHARRDIPSRMREPRASSQTDRRRPRLCENPEGVRSRPKLRGLSLASFQTASDPERSRHRGPFMRQAPPADLGRKGPRLRREPSCARHGRRNRSAHADVGCPG